MTIHSFALFYHKLSDEEKLKVTLKIVGSGPELNFLRDLAKRKGVSDRVVFIDWIERKDLLKLYKTSSLFLFPSHEGAGMVVAEAMSFGLPVVCLDNSGPGEFVDEASGIAIKESSYDETVSELSKGISSIFHKTSLTSRSGARLRFENQFRWDVRGEQLKKIYSDLLS